MISVKYLFGLSWVQILLLASIPWKIGDSLQVIEADVVLLVTRAELSEFLYLTGTDLFGLLW